MHIPNIRLWTDLHSNLSPLDTVVSCPPPDLKMCKWRHSTITKNLSTSVDHLQHVAIHSLTTWHGSDDKDFPTGRLPIARPFVGDREGCRIQKWINIGIEAAWHHLSDLWSGQKVACANDKLDAGPKHSLMESRWTIDGDLIAKELISTVEYFVGSKLSTTMKGLLEALRRKLLYKVQKGIRLVLCIVVEQLMMYWLHQKCHSIYIGRVHSEIIR